MEDDLSRKGILRDAWLRALNVKGQGDESLKKAMKKAEPLIFDAAKPARVYRIIPREELPSGGFAIERHLEKSTRVAVMAVTLGVGIDILIGRYEVMDMAMAVIIDCGASVLVEQVCDDLEKEIKDSQKGFVTSRFSPGYGDYDIRFQGDIVELLDGGRRIGLTVTKDSLMIPRKSITAVIGLSDTPVKGRPAGCGECVLKDKCSIKKEGRYCGDKF